MTNEELERDIAEYVAFIFREVQAERGQPMDDNLSNYAYLVFSDNFFPDRLPQQLPEKIIGFKIILIPTILFRNEYTFGLWIDYLKVPPASTYCGQSVYLLGEKLNRAILAMQDTFPFYDDNWRKEVGLK